MAIQAITSYGTAVNQTGAAAVKRDEGSSGGAAATESRTSRTQQSSNTSSVTLEDYIYDVRDLNKDGYVSALEELLYELEHPGAAAESTAAAASGGTQAAKLYDQQGNVSPGSSVIPGAVNLYV